MFVPRFKRVAVVGLAGLVLATGTGWLLLRATGAPPPEADRHPFTSQDLRFERSNLADSPLAAAKRDAARRTFDSLLARLQQGVGDLEGVSAWSRRWVLAELPLARTAPEHLRSLQAYVIRTRSLEKMAQDRSRAGQGGPADASAAEFYRLEAELWLEEAKARVPRVSLHDVERAAVPFPDTRTIQFLPDGKIPLSSERRIERRSQ